MRIRQVAQLKRHQNLLPDQSRAQAGSESQKEHASAADIDDQNLSLHERAAAPNASGKLPVASHGSAKTLEKALLFWFCRSAGMPAFHYFESEKPEQQLPRRFQIEPQILGNLLHRPGAIELRRELGLVRSQLQLLHQLEAVFRERGNGCRVEVCGLIRILHKAQGLQRPVAYIWLTRHVPGVT